MHRKTLTLVFGLFLLSTSCLAITNKQSAIKVGIIIPLEHEAMNEIVSGFKTSLSKHYSGHIQYHVENAQHDPNLQHSIITQMKSEPYNLIVPIGTNTTEMAVAMIKHKPIVGLAIDYSSKQRSHLHHCHLAIVHDQVNPRTQFTFIHKIYPNIKHIVLIHSTDDNIMPEVNASILAAKKSGITLIPIMVSTLPDMVSALNAIPGNTQALFVLKDNLIVSGIATLANVAKEKQIPLITSDQGSVQQGGGFALGVRESQIGVDGGILAAKILKGKSACSLPIVNMTHLTVFINKHALQQSGQLHLLTQITMKAKKSGYHSVIF